MLKGFPIRKINYSNIEVKIQGDISLEYSQCNFPIIEPIIVFSATLNKKWFFENRGNEILEETTEIVMEVSVWCGGFAISVARTKNEICSPAKFLMERRRLRNPCLECKKK